MSNDIEDLNFVLVGSHTVGKSSLYFTFNGNKFPGEYIPTVYNIHGYDNSLTVDGQNCKLYLMDTHCQEEYDRLRLLNYPNTNLILICYSVDNPSSLEHVKTKWLPEVTQYCPNAPIVLVACKIDLRETTEGGNIIKKEEGHRVAQDLGFQYFETSSLKNEGVRDCFEFAVRVYRVHRDGKCICKVPDCKLPHGRELTEDERKKFKRPEGNSQKKSCTVI